MNWDQIEGKWRQSVGTVKEKWGKLTDDDMDVIRGKRDQLVGKIQERYGIVKEEAEKQVADFERTYPQDEVVVEETTTTERKVRPAKTKATRAGKV
jgi:uncharacterized protein YjbJ (UPF0337 family)